jgi:signal transduction histidine kinase
MPENALLTPAVAQRWLDRPTGEALREIDAEVAAADRAGGGPALVGALVWQAQLRGHLGRDDAEVALQRAWDEVERLGDGELRCHALLARARLAADRGRHAAALADCRAALDLARGLGLASLVRQALFTSATSLCHLGEHDLAVESFEEARMMLRAEPDALSAADRQVALGRYAAGQAQAWLMRAGLLLEASGPEQAQEAFARARRLGEQACTMLRQASPRFSHAALFGLVRVLLEADEADEARRWVARVTAHAPVAAPPGSLALAHRVLSEAMIELRAGQGGTPALRERLREVEAVPHPRVTGGDLRLSLLRCLFEAYEQAGDPAQALEYQRQWSRTKARVRAALAIEHDQWTRETLAALRTEADRFVTQDLRAPLLQASALLGRFAGAPPADAARSGLDRAGHSVRRAIDIADQYLGVMRAEHLRHADLEVLELSPLVHDVCDQLAPLAADGVRLERRVRLQVRVRGDRVLLMRALGNLLSNAFKHAPPGSAVRVRLQPRRDGVWLSVSDQGPGMPLDMRVRLFQRFATGSVRKGNGLGLAMVARAARVHQARIEVDSEVGRGTTVALVLNAERDGG